MNHIIRTKIKQLAREGHTAAYIAGTMSIQYHTQVTIDAVKGVAPNAKLKAR